MRGGDRNLAPARRHHFAVESAATLPFYDA
jgi:hypothetical protein